MTDHTSPLAPGKGSYDYYRCRCDECRAANAAYQRQLRKRSGRAKAHRDATSRAQMLAATWVRQHKPEVWSRLLHQAQIEKGVDEHPDLRTSS